MIKTVTLGSYTLRVTQMKGYIKEKTWTNHAFSWTNHAFVYKKTNELRCNLDKSRMKNY